MLPIALLMMLLLAQTGQNTTPGQSQTPTFQANTQLVVETVTVKDKEGRPVTGLNAKDFVVTEDGVAQEVRFFEFQKLEEATPAAPIPQSKRIAPFSRFSLTQIAPEPPGEIRYRDRRLLALYFDLSAMPVPDQVRAFNAAKQFVRGQMTTADLMAIMVFTSGSVQVLQDFTDDRERLLATLETLIVGEDENAPPDPADASRADTGAAFGQNDAEFNIFNTDRQLAALQTAATMLGRLNEKKSLVYFASGLRLNGVEQPGATAATINAAIRAKSRSVRSMRAGWSLKRRWATRRAARRAGWRCTPEPRPTRPSATSSARRTRCTRWRRTPAARRCSTTTTSRGAFAGAAGHQELLHHRLLHDERQARRQVPAHQDLTSRGPVGDARLPAGLLRRQAVRQVHARPTRSASSKTR